MNMQTKRPKTGMQRARRIGASLVVALPLSLAAAGTLTITSSILDASPAAAWGLGDLKKAAKNVGGALKETGKAAGKISKGATNLGLGLASEVGKTVTIDIPRSVAKGAGIYDERMEKQFDRWERRIDNNVNVDGIARAGSAAGKKVGKVIIGKNKIGESLPRESAQQRAQRKAKMEAALGRYVNRRGNASRTPYAYKGPKGTLKTGIVKGGAFYRGNQGIKRKDAVRNKDYSGGYRQPIGNDKSVWGRPVYGKGPIGGRQQIGNDKSVAGRPVYGKRPTRKVQGIRLGDVQAGPKRNRNKNTRDARRKNGEFNKDRRFKRDKKRFSRDRKFRQDRKRLSRDKRLKRNKRMTRNKRFERNSRKRMSRQVRSNRKARGFKMKRNRGGNNRRRNSRRNR